MNAINAFVKEKTHGLIDNFLQNPILETRIAILSTSYLKAEWEKKFPRELTRKRNFINIDGTDSQTDFMNIEEDFPYSSIDGITCVTLPYGKGNYSMSIFTPDDVNVAESDILRFAEMRERLTTDRLRELLAARQKYTVKLSMPKFECEDSPKFTDVLEHFKLIDLPFYFVRKGQDPLNIYLRGGEQAAKIKVNEEGTEAGGAAILDFSDGETITVNINRPFIYLIREESTGIVLFAGAMTKF